MLASNATAAKEDAMTRSEDTKWEIIQSALAAESSGKSPRLFSSRRTLFGIPSALDEEMAKLDEANAAKAREQRVAAARQQVDESASASAPERQGAPNGIASTRRAKAHAAINASSRARRTAAHVVHPLEPVFDRHARVLLLGTMPSPKSRETGFYYGHPQNRFWKVMAALFNAPVPKTMQDKTDLLHEHGIALWDVLAECTIEGASDGTIAECVPNDIAWLLGKAPVDAVFCTGAKATELYRKYCEPATHMPCTQLPSTSPANAAASLDKLIEAYRVIPPHCR